MKQYLIETFKALGAAVVPTTTCGVIAFVIAWYARDTAFAGAYLSQFLIGAAATLVAMGAVEIFLGAAARLPLQRLVSFSALEKLGTMQIARSVALVVMCVVLWPPASEGFFLLKGPALVACAFIANVVYGFGGQFDRDADGVRHPSVLTCMQEKMKSHKVSAQDDAG